MNCLVCLPDKVVFGNSQIQSGDFVMEIYGIAEYFVLDRMPYTCRIATGRRDTYMICFSVGK